MVGCSVRLTHTLGALHNVAVFVYYPWHKEWQGKSTGYSAECDY